MFKRNYAKPASLGPVLQGQRLAYYLSFWSVVASFLSASALAQTQSPKRPDDFLVDVSAACVEVSRPTPVAGVPSGVPLVKVVPLEPADGAAGHGLFRLLVRQEDELPQCPGGAVNLFFSRLRDLPGQERARVAGDFLVKPVCATKKDSGVYSAMVCFKSKPVTDDCPGGNGLLFTFFSPSRGQDFDRAYAAATTKLIFCDELSGDRRSLRGN